MPLVNILEQDAYEHRKSIPKRSLFHSLKNLTTKTIQVYKYYISK